jgi:hypothetical protein
MVDPAILDAFFEKLGDIIVSPRGHKNAPLTAAGAFVGREGGGSEFHKLLKEHGSFQRAKAAYQKAHPDDFITLAFKREAPPRRGGFLGIGGDKHYSAKLKDYSARKKSPRVFIRDGRAASYAQGTLYKEVARGLYDRELNKPWLSKKDRVVYS